MPAINKIVSRKVVDTVVKDGSTVLISAATETLTWKRTEAMAEKVGGDLKNAVGGWDGKLPPGTTEVCSRESEHQSDADKRDHITAVAIDANGKGKTIHVPVKKD